jgi:ribosomal protein S18 acetylase RimI-like enzyme
MKLEQIYLLEEYRGKGLGGLMLRHVEAEALKKNVRFLMLQVNKHNKDSIAIYRKAGFQVREGAIFDIGNGYFMDDYVMEKTI